MNKLKRYAVNTLTRPFSRKVNLYESPEYKKDLAETKNPKSPRYKKTLTDKAFDNLLEGSSLVRNFSSWRRSKK